MLKKSCASRCAEFTFYFAAVDRNIPEDKRSSRSGYRENTVGTLDLATANMYRGDHNLVRAELVHEHTYCRNISDCVHCANFVEMYLVNWNAVGIALSLTDELIYR